MSGSKLTTGQRLKEQTKERKSKEKFLTTRMWMSTIMSALFNDRGTIPKNIGNNILVLNNVAVTKNHITAEIIIKELSEYTPVGWTSDLIEVVKNQIDFVEIDFVFRGSTYQPDVSASGMNSRRHSWENTLENPLMPEEAVRRAARCLYSLDVLRSKAKAYKVRTYIKVRAKDNRTLKKALSCVYDYLRQIGATYKRIDSGLDEHLRYETFMSRKRPPHIKDFPAQIHTAQTICESMPMLQGMHNKESGTVFGADMITDYPYRIDFRKSAGAKNVMIEADSGSGKTFTASWWIYPFYADNYNISIMDIKGTEFAAITQALHGLTLSMRSSSTRFVNTFRWRKEECLDGDFNTYANERMSLSKEMMLLFCDPTPEMKSKAESFLEEFLQAVYRNIGADVRNPNSWSRTDALHPYIIYDWLVKFTSHEIKCKYGDVATDVGERLAMYMSRGGSNSHMFKEEFTMEEILNTRVLTFDFGILEASSGQDKSLFKVKVFFMRILNDAFVSYKKSLGEWTVKILEESQIIGDYLTKIYTKEVTLRRAQNQITILLGNSVSALVENPLAKPMLDNINIMVLGSLTKSSRKYLTEEYGLKDVESDLLEAIQGNSDLTHTFLLVNRMEKDATTCMLKTDVPSSVVNSSLFRVVDTEV